MPEHFLEDKVHKAWGGGYYLRGPKARSCRCRPRRSRWIWRVFDTPCAWGSKWRVLRLLGGTWSLEPKPLALAAAWLGLWRRVLLLLVALLRDPWVQKLRDGSGFWSGPRYGGFWGFGGGEKQAIGLWLVSKKWWECLSLQETVFDLIFILICSLLFVSWPLGLVWVKWQKIVPTYTTSSSDGNISPIKWYNILVIFISFLLLFLCFIFSFISIIYKEKIVKNWWNFWSFNILKCHLLKKLFKQNYD